VVSAVEITLPQEYIRTGRRVLCEKNHENEGTLPVGKDHGVDDFLLGYEALLEQALKLFGAGITQEELISAII
jgi:hypothetical protein